MEKYVVTGGAVLKGEVTISGAKNAVVAIIPATVLARDVCVIENIPNISDVTALLNILRDLGAKVRLLDKTCLLLFPGLAAGPLRTGRCIAARRLQLRRCAPH